MTFFAAVRFLLTLATALAGLAVLGGYAGALHPLGDSLAVFRLAFAAALGLGSVVLVGGNRRWSIGVALAGLAILPILWGMYRPEAEVRADLTLYQKNLSFRLKDPAPLLAEIEALAPDFLTLQEVTPDHRATILAALSDRLPTQHSCLYARVGRAALASRFPAVPGSRRCEPGLGYAAMQVIAPQGPVWLVSLHMHWPYPYQQAEQAAAILPQLRALEGPVILGGDFNMVAWGHVLDRFADATGTRRQGRLAPTHYRAGGLVPLGIDHVLLSPHMTATVEPRPLLGSDHKGLLARIATGP